MLPCFNKAPRWCSCTIQFENHQTRSLTSISHSDSYSPCCLHLLTWLLGEEKQLPKGCVGTVGDHPRGIKWSDAGKGPNRSHVFCAFHGRLTQVPRPHMKQQSCTIEAVDTFCLQMHPPRCALLSIPLILVLRKGCWVAAAEPRYW